MQIVLSLIVYPKQSLKLVREIKAKVDMYSSLAAFCCYIQSNTTYCISFAATVRFPTIYL